jgi:1,4-dihydroxy-2-naphthoate octaprenyltransferase
MTTDLARPALPAPSSLAAWIAACRPATLSASAVPVLVGSACAAAVGAFRAGPALAALAGAFCIQIGTNLANDVFDFEKGADTGDRVGPVRAVQAGLLTAAQVRRGMVLAFGLACLAGVSLILVGGWPIVVIGIASILAGIAYTGGPWPLGYHGLGDVFVMLFFGFVAVCGTAFVQVGAVPDVAWLAAVPVGALSTAILVVNNLRDRHTDVGAGKRTLAVRFGRRFALGEYVALVALAFVGTVLVAASARSAWPLLALGALPIAVSLSRKVAVTEGAALNPLLGATARLLLVHGVLLVVGLVLSAPR